MSYLTSSNLNCTLKTKKGLIKTKCIVWPSKALSMEEIGERLNSISTLFILIFARTNYDAFDTSNLAKNSYAGKYFYNK